MPTTFLTHEGYQKLQEELEYLRTQKRQEIAERLHEAMEGGELILFRTEVAGTVTYPILNPSYDDSVLKDLIKVNSDNIVSVGVDLTTAKGRITTTEEKIASILAVLDADSDGSIVDALADLKAQWESADSGLTNLISDKIGTATFNTLKDEVIAARGTYGSLQLKLQSIIDSIHNYDDVVIKGDIDDIKLDIQTLTASVANITKVSEDLAALTLRVKAIEDKTTISLKDSVTGWDYTIKVTSGVLSADLVKILTSVLVERASAGSIHVGDMITFNVTPKNQDGSTAIGSTLSYSVDDTSKASITGSGQLTAIAIGNVTVKVSATIDTKTVDGQIIITIVITDAEKLTASATNFDTTMSAINLTNITSDFVLPVVQDAATVVWSSNNNVAIGITGGNATVTRPTLGSGDATVVLTATLSVNAESTTKTYNVTVKESTI